MPQSDEQIAELRRLEKAATPGPWNPCNKGNCQCKQLWCADHPVAEITHGKWGDNYASLRIVGPSSLELKAEAYMEQITYGEVTEETATANIQFIAALRNAAPDLLDELERLREAAAWAYQAIGAQWPNREALDNLSALSSGNIAPHPWPVVPPSDNERLRKIEAAARGVDQAAKEFQIGFNGLMGPNLRILRAALEARDAK